MFEILTVPLVLVIGDRRLPTLRFRGKYLFERESVVGVRILIIRERVRWSEQIYIYYVQFSLIFVPGETSNDCVCTDTVTLVSFSKYIIRDITQSREDPIGLEVVEFHFWNVSNCRR